MSSFSADWLALREPADHRSVNAQVRAAFVEDFAGQERVSIMDIGCGTGSNLRSLAPHLGPRQVWRLVDYDAELLNAARETLSRWADHAQDRNGSLMLSMRGQVIEVAFLCADLATGLEQALDHDCDAVTAAAFFDLVSQDWIAQFCAALAARRRRLYTVLTYDGREIWTPPSPAEAAMLEAFHAHQAGDKGFGAAAGSRATQALCEDFGAHGYAVTTGKSPWLLGQADRALMQELARGSACAVAETGKLSAADITAWLAARSHAEHCEIGHIDLYARAR